MSSSDKGGVYWLTPEEIEALRAEMKASGQWMKRQLEIDPVLRHLDDDRPPLDDRIRQAPTLEDAIREVMGDDSLAPADDSEGTSDAPPELRGR